MLRASQNPQADLINQLGVQIGQGVTGWVAEHREPVAIAESAFNDPRFKAFKNLPEDHFEAMLCTPILCANRVVGVITLQHRLSYHQTANEVRLLSMIGFLVGRRLKEGDWRMKIFSLQLGCRRVKLWIMRRGFCSEISRSQRKKRIEGCRVRAGIGESPCARSQRQLCWAMTYEKDSLADKTFVGRAARML